MKNSIQNSNLFFQAEDGIRDYKVTGVQTCALPIYAISLVGDVHDVVVLAKGRCFVRRQFAVTVLFIGEHDDAVSFVFAFVRELQALREEDAPTTQTTSLFADSITQRKSPAGRDERSGMNDSVVVARRGVDLRVFAHLASEDGEAKGYFHAAHLGLAREPTTHAS